LGERKGRLKEVALDNKPWHREGGEDNKGRVREEEEEDNRALERLAIQESVAGWERFYVVWPS
jgi:hypothetical protein